MNKKLFQHLAVPAGLLVAVADVSAEYRFTDLGTLGIAIFYSPNSYGRAINSSGQLAEYADARGSQTPALWNVTVATDLGAPSDRGGLRLAINDAGKIVGWVKDVTTGSSQRYRPTVWNGTTPADLSVLRGCDGGGQARAVNNRGQIARYSLEGGAVATLWDCTLITNPTPEWIPYGGVAGAINDNGQAVGYSTIAIGGGGSLRYPKRATL